MAIWTIIMNVVEMQAGRQGRAGVACGWGGGGGGGGGRGGMGSGMRFRVWSNETTAAQRPEMTGKKQQGVNSMKSRRHGRHRNRLPYMLPDSKQTNKQVKEGM